jgi:NAD(P)-dependent dehydrogenase (short-subunit alcohol dehydrogenase family)
MTKRFEGKVALVTGGASGIGRATALGFAREGATVVVSDVNVPGGEETVGLISKEGGTARFLRCDVSRAAEVEALVRGTVEAFGRLDCAFNNAGTGGRLAPLVEMTEEDWDRTLDINLKGVFLGLRYELPVMLKQGGGVIVNTASVAGLVGSRGTSAYTASKHGIVGLTKAAALEYAQANIRVNAVCPGVVRTPMIEGLFKVAPAVEQGLIGAEPVGRMADPAEIADAVLWLCSPGASFMTGAAVPVDGGYVAQ